MSIIQLIVIIGGLHDGGSGATVSWLNVVSLLLSVTSMASKSFMFSYSPHTPTFIFNMACFVADIFGLFSTLSFAFLVIPSTSAYTDYSVSIYSAIWFLVQFSLYAFAALTAVVFALVQISRDRSACDIFLGLIGFLLGSLAFVPCMIVLSSLHFCLIPLLLFESHDLDSSSSGLNKYNLDTDKARMLDWLYWGAENEQHDDEEESVRKRLFTLNRFVLTQRFTQTHKLTKQDGFYANPNIHINHLINHFYPHTIHAHDSPVLLCPPTVSTLPTLPPPALPTLALPFWMLLHRDRVHDVTLTAYTMKKSLWQQVQERGVLAGAVLLVVLIYTSYTIFSVIYPFLSFSLLLSSTSSPISVAPIQCLFFFVYASLIAILLLLSPLVLLFVSYRFLVFSLYLPSPNWSQRVIDAHNMVRRNKRILTHLNHIVTTSSSSPLLPVVLNRIVAEYAFDVDDGVRAWYFTSSERDAFDAVYARDRIHQLHSLYLPYITITSPVTVINTTAGNVDDDHNNHNKNNNNRSSIRQSNHNNNRSGEAANNPSSQKERHKKSMYDEDNKEDVDDYDDDRKRFVIDVLVDHSQHDDLKNLEKLCVKNDDSGGENKNKIDRIDVSDSVDVRFHIESDVDQERRSRGSAHNHSAHNTASASTMTMTTTTMMSVAATTTAATRTTTVVAVTEAGAGAAETTTTATLLEPAMSSPILPQSASTTMMMTTTTTTTTTTSCSMSTFNESHYN